MNHEFLRFYICQAPIISHLNVVKKILTIFTEYHLKFVIWINFLKFFIIIRKKIIFLWIKNIWVIM